MAEVQKDQVQGDVIIGLQKNYEGFLFLEIKDAQAFKEALPRLDVSYTTDVLESQDRFKEAQKHGHRKVWVKNVHLGIAFTARALQRKLGVANSEMPPDPVFQAGQFASAPSLGDNVDADGSLSDWKKPFSEQRERIDVLILICAESGLSLHQALHDTLHLFGTSVNLVYSLDGHVRPGAEAGHEHFGFKDGISNPSLAEFEDPAPSATKHHDIVEPKVLLTGFNGEPEWTRNGSYLVFRQLEQRVPEFHKFTRDTALGLATQIPGISSEFIGARLVGRWPSGAPLNQAPIHDDTTLANDPKRVNDFDYADEPKQAKCPYASHVRKTNPRNGTPLDNKTAIQPRLMVRNGIPYGGEVTAAESLQCKTLHERGLVFVAYQGSITDGFEFVQKTWSNNVGFPPNALGFEEVGFDLVIGQKNSAVRTAQGIDPTDVDNPDNFTTAQEQWVISRGGEYFFTPSRDGLAKLAGVQDDGQRLQPEC